jgi:hypothetical protein
MTQSTADKFLDLLKQSVIVQATVTLILIIALVVMWIMRTPVPNEMYELTFAVVAFWFGSKVGYSQGMNLTNSNPPTNQK